MRFILSVLQFIIIILGIHIFPVGYSLFPIAHPPLICSHWLLPVFQFRCTSDFHCDCYWVAIAPAWPSRGGKTTKLKACGHESDMADMGMGAQMSMKLAIPLGIDNKKDKIQIGYICILINTNQYNLYVNQYSYNFYMDWYPATIVYGGQAAAVIF